MQRTRQYTASIAEWREVLATRPDDEYSNRSLGTVLMMTGHAEEAGVYLRKAAEIKLRTAVADDPKSAQAHADLAAKLEETGRATEAAAEYRKAIELKPDSVAMRVGLGQALTGMGKLNDAVVELRKAVDADSESAPAHDALGEALDRQGDLQSAVREWRRALDIDPQNAEIHEDLGDALLAHGRQAEALAEWRAAIGLRPNDVPMLEKAAWLLATSPETAVRNGGEAMTFAARAIQYSARKDAHVLETLAAAYAEEGEFDYAESTEREAMALAEPDSRPATQELQARLAMYESHQPFRDRENVAEGK